MATELLRISVANGEPKAAEATEMLDLIAGTNAEAPTAATMNGATIAADPTINNIDGTDEAPITSATDSAMGGEQVASVEADGGDKMDTTEEGAPVTEAGA